MERVTLRIPEGNLEDVETLVEEDIFPNRSEAIRAAIRDLTQKHGVRPRMMADGSGETVERGTDHSEFSFEEGDTVLVRVRENGTSGNIVVKFTAECQEIETFPTGRTQATFELPGMMNRVSYATYEAEFEVVDDE